MPNNKEKILLFDFDGTLHNHGVVLPETYEALEYARKKGCKLFVNTGRTKHNLITDLKNIVKFDFDGILCGGSSIYMGKNYDLTVCEQPELTDEIMVKTLKFIRDKSYWATIEGNAGYYVIEQHGEITYTAEERQQFYEKALAIYKSLKPFKIAIWPPKHLNDYDLPDLLKELDWIYYDEWHYYEGFYKGCGKDHVIEKLSRTLGVSTDDFISFGDSENDIPAFKASGKSVAMAQSSKSVKEAATFSATTPAGVAEGIYHYIK